VSFNGVLASQAVTEVLQLLTGFRGVGSRRVDLQPTGTLTFRGYKKFDGISGNINEWGGVRRTDCRHCRNVSDARDVLFAAISRQQTSAA
jgi:hypothetical protein